MADLEAICANRIYRWILKQLDVGQAHEPTAGQRRASGPGHPHGRKLASLFDGNNEVRQNGFDLVLEDAPCRRSSTIQAARSKNLPLK
jgi:hypothetical protein